MNYKNKAEAKHMADYYAEKASREAEKLVLIENAIRERIVVELNMNELINKHVRDAIKTDIEILDEIDENLQAYKGWRDEALADVKDFDFEEMEANKKGMAECASILAQDVEETISKEEKQ